MLGCKTEFPRVPQLWLTYDELADALGCDAAQARGTVIKRAWTRKHSTDGLTRVLMPRDAMLAYFRSVASELATPSPFERAPAYLARAG